MRVLATAGHVDHGKSTLVRALTGRDPDRLAEEKRRGLTIELGYCWTELGGHEVAFVDVPGHERFVTTTLAGLGPVPAVMFVVAADDPWMPQAAEHLTALDALGVERGVLVVTRADLADPSPALARARAQLEPTSLSGIAAVTVSGRTGEGLDRLRETLAQLVGSLPEPDPSADVRLWVDRRFHVRGTGTVVTGTLPAGTIRAGDRLVCADGEVRVRAVESLDVPRDAVSGVARVALALGGRVPDGLRRDDVLVTPGTHPSVRVADVAVSGTPPERPLLHVGATSTSVHARPLDAGYLRIALERPLPLLVGDRALLRDPGSREVWGVRVLAVDPAPLRRRGAARRRAGELAGEVPPLVPEPDPVPPAEPLPPSVVAGLAEIRADLAESPFAAPDAERLAGLGLEVGDLVRLAEAGELLRLGGSVVLMPGADDQAVDLLAVLEQPFTTSRARTALGTSRRVVLPLLAHLDRTGRTVRLPDDRRRVRLRAGVPGHD